MDDDLHSWDVSQAQAVAYDGPGPVLVRGRAGTGRTSVLAGRIAAVLRQPSLVHRRILAVTPFAGGAEELRRQIAARVGSLPVELEIRTIDDLCSDLLRAAGASVEVVDEVDDAGFLTDAIAAVRRRGMRPILARSVAFFADEIGEVIRGRGLGRRDEYLALERDGRWRGLDAAVRETLWEVYDEYQRRLDASGRSDSLDLPRRAREVLGRISGAGADEVYVDDAHALSRAGLQLCRDLARPSDRLWIFQDDEQRYQRQGFTLKEAGIDVRRSFELTKPWRQPEPLRRYCDALAIDDPAAQRTTIIPRCPAVEVMAADDFVGQFRLAADEAAALASDGTPPGRIAALTLWPRNAHILRAMLAARGLESTAAHDPAAPGIFASTIQDARGRDFDAVIVVDVSRGTFPSDDAGTDPTAVLRDRRRLYAAVTRARSRLVLVHQAGLGSPFLPTLV